MPTETALTDCPSLSAVPVAPKRCEFNTPVTFRFMRGHTGIRILPGEESPVMILAVLEGNVTINGIKYNIRGRFYQDTSGKWVGGSTGNMQNRPTVQLRRLERPDNPPFQWDYPTDAAQSIGNGPVLAALADVLNDGDMSGAVVRCVADADVREAIIRHEAATARVDSLRAQLEAAREEQQAARTACSQAGALRRKIG